MDHIQGSIDGSVTGSINSDQFPFFTGEYLPAPITCRDYLVLHHDDINFYFVDLMRADWGRIRNIVKGCEEVESACWKPQENFSDYLKKCDAMSYAEKDGRIIGFAAAHLLFTGNTCVYSNDETMVLKEFRDKRLALSLVGVPLEWFFAKTESFKGTENFVYTSISANPRVVNFYFKQSYCRTLFDCSFKPSPELIKIKDEYCRKHNIDLVHENYPFCLKNLFPGSNDFDAHDPRFQFSENVKANMPREFDHMDRGDAFAFMLRLPTKAARTVVFCIMARCFGKDYFSRNGLGYFSPRTANRYAA